MNIIAKIIEFLKKIGMLKVEAPTKSSYTSSKDAGYQPPDPLDN